MKAMLFEAFGQAPEIRTVPDPAPAPDGVVIAVMATGLCRSDWHGWIGHDPEIRLPHVPGHEFAGIVVACGEQVGRFQVGDRSPCRSSRPAGIAGNVMPGISRFARRSFSRASPIGGRSPTSSRSTGPTTIWCGCLTP